MFYAHTQQYFTNLQLQDVLRDVNKSIYTQQPPGGQRDVDYYGPTTQRQRTHAAGEEVQDLAEHPEKDVREYTMHNTRILKKVTARRGHTNTFVSVCLEIMR